MQNALENILRILSMHVSQPSCFEGATQKIFICTYVYMVTPQDLPKSFLNGIISSIKCIFSYTQFHYNFESDLRLLDATTHCKTQYISYLHAYIQTVKKPPIELNKIN